MELYDIPEKPFNGSGVCFVIGRTIRFEAQYIIEVFPPFFIKFRI
jgi:hypothetical protein